MPIDDKRNYKVSFDKMYNLLGIKNEYNIYDAIEELITSFKDKSITSKDFHTNSLETITEFFKNKERYLTINNK